MKHSLRKTLLIISTIFMIQSVYGQEKWQPLFNGKNLKGWTQRGGEALYSVEDGAISGMTTANTANSFLCTNENFADFIFELDFKIGGEVNSGIQFRSQSTKEYKDFRVHGLQYEMDPSSRAWSGGIYDEARRGWLYNLEINPAAKKAFKKGEWNHVRIEAIGNSVRTWLNGVPCASILDNVTTDGFIGLQVHSITKPEEKGVKIYWKNIRICTEDLDKVKTPDWREIPQVNCMDNTISEREAEEGWKLIWDGSTTQGWRGARLDIFPTKGWTIEKGVLKVLASEGGESANGGDIVTTRAYGNFELKVDFLLTEGANSGIKYFVDPGLNKGEGSAIGCEFQLLDDQKHPDALKGIKGNRTLGSLYDLIPANPAKPFKGIGEWNTALIIVRDTHVEHWLNNVKIVEYERNTQMWRALVAGSKYKDWPDFGEAATGHILLQDHGNEVWFKNIKIKEL